MGRVDMSNVERVLTYQQPDGAQKTHYLLIAEKTEDLIRQILLSCPDSADRTTAIRCAREARMWANASIALRGEI